MPQSPIAVVVPCYNEETRLAVEVFRRFLAGAEPVDFVFVNDGSRDRTDLRLNEIRSGWEERVTILGLDRNRGKAEAVRLGMLQAIQSGYPFVGFWDADLATPLQAISEFHKVLDSHPRVEWVFGSRVRLLGRSIDRRAMRHYLGRVFATATSLTLKLPVYDTQCGAKLFRIVPDSPSIFERPFTSRWIFDVELIARLIQQRRDRMGEQAADVIYEYPLGEWRDVQGSKLRTADFLRAALELIAIRRQYLSQPVPPNGPLAAGPPIGKFGADIQRPVNSR